MRRKKRGRKKRMSTFKAGVIGTILLVVFVYLGFTKFANPFASQYTVNAVFSNANGLRPASLVRIAGINVGKVESIEPVTACAGQKPPCTAAKVKLTVQDNGLPLHKDATFAIRPRIFLEGNFFVDVHPGTPEAPVAPEGYTFPIQNGVEPVQFDQVLSTLQSDTRRNLQILLHEYGTAVKVGGPAYNNSIQYWLPAYEYSAIVNHDALGIQPHDLSNWIDKGGAVNAALDAHPNNLKNLITDFNTTAAAFAREQANLARTVAVLPHTLSVAIPAFNALNASFPPTRALARALLPGVKSTNPMINASLPFFTQLRLLMQPSELQGLSADLKVTIPALSQLTVETIPFMRNQVRPASSCQVNVVLPWSRLTIPDPHFNASNGFPPRPVYVEAVDFLPGLAGESRNFDSNGPYIRVGLSAGASLTYTLANGAFGQAAAPLEGAQPPAPAKRPPLAGGDAPNSPCETQAPITDLSAPSLGAPSPQNPGLPAAKAAKDKKSTQGSSSASKTSTTQGGQTTPTLPATPATKLPATPAAATPPKLP